MAFPFLVKKQSIYIKYACLSTWSSLISKSIFEETGGPGLFSHTWKEVKVDIEMLENSLDCLKHFAENYSTATSKF